jgi:hypothetical protein
LRLASLRFKVSFFAESSHPMSKASQQQEPDKADGTPASSAPLRRKPRESAQRAFDERDKWANSPGLQPPK